MIQRLDHALAGGARAMRTRSPQARPAPAAGDAIENGRVGELDDEKRRPKLATIWPEQFRRGVTGDW